jgi:hypothetical protein
LDLRQIDCQSIHCSISGHPGSGTKSSRHSARPGAGDADPQAAQAAPKAATLPVTMPADLGFNWFGQLTRPRPDQEMLSQPRPNGQFLVCEMNKVSV